MSVRLRRFFDCTDGDEQRFRNGFDIIVRIEVVPRPARERTNDKTTGKSIELLALADMRLQLEPRDEEGRGTDTLELKPSRECTEGLAGMGGRPWARMPHTNKPLSPKGLAKMLRGFDIHPVTQRYRGKPTKVYRRADFLDAWARYRAVTGDKLEGGNSVTPQEENT